MSDDSQPGILRLDVQRLPAGGVVVSAAGEIDISTAPQLRATLLQVADAPAADGPAVLDLTEVSFLDSTGLGALNVARQYSRDRGLAWRLCGLQPMVRRVFELTGVVQIFAVYSDVAAAVADDKPKEPADRQPG